MLRKCAHPAGMSKWGFWLPKRGAGGNEALTDTSGNRSTDLFSIQALYDRYGREIYARAAVDEAFSAAISDMAASIREDLEREGPRVARLLTDKTGLSYFLLGHTHAVLARLLEVAVRPDALTPAVVDPDFAAVRLGALFHLAFDGGLLRLPS